MPGHTIKFKNSQKSLLEKMKKRLIISFVFLILVSLIAIAHEADNYDLTPSNRYPISQFNAVGYGSLAFFTMIFFIVIFNKSMSDSSKKIAFSLIIIVVASVTIYIVSTTIHLNIVSLTKGPVHWHADFEIWICDREIHIKKPERFLSNKQGVDLLHSHQDKRIHVEGVITDMRSASLGGFFHTIGGSLSNDKVEVPTDYGAAIAKNGESCNDIPARLYVFVNGKPILNYADYVISPYEKVPPGDRIKIIFTERPLDEANALSAGHDDVEGLQPICDLDADFDCDNEDLVIFESSVGRCKDQFKQASDVLADVNGDGCITSEDRALMLQYFGDK